MFSLVSNFLKLRRVVIRNVEGCPAEGFSHFEWPQKESVRRGVFSWLQSSTSSLDATKFYTRILNVIFCLLTPT